MSLIVAPQPMYDRAITELACASPQCSTANAPDFHKTVSVMQELWEAYYDRGAITDKPAQELSTRHRSLRADGLSLNPETYADAFSLTSTISEAAYNGTPMDDGAIFDCMMAKAEAHKGKPTLIGEAFCWNCLGWDHTENKASPSAPPRAISAPCSRAPSR